MSEFEDRLNSILNDPEQMEKIADMAKSLMGGGEEGRETPPAPTVPAVPSVPALAGLDAGVLQGMGKVLNELNNPRQDEKTALLEAMKPFLSDKRREKMDRAMKLAKMTRLAEAAFGEFGGKFHV